MTLGQFFKFIAQDSTKYARLEVNKIKSFIESLKNSPYIGRFYSQIKGREIRSVVFKQYIIFYSISANQIEIATIHHHSRSMANNPALGHED